MSCRCSANPYTYMIIRYVITKTPPQDLRRPDSDPVMKSYPAAQVIETLDQALNFSPIRHRIIGITSYSSGHVAALVEKPSYDSNRMEVSYNYTVPTDMSTSTVTFSSEPYRIVQEPSDLYMMMPVSFKKNLDFLEDLQKLNSTLECSWLLPLRQISRAFKLLTNNQLRKLVRVITMAIRLKF